MTNNDSSGESIVGRQPRLVVVARWAVLLPAAVAAAFLALVISRMFFLFIMSDSMFRAIVSELFPGIAFGQTLILAAVFIAPSLKRNVGFTIFGLLLLVIGFGVAVALLRGTGDWQQAVAITGTVLGAGLATWQEMSK